jgi:hypothetical protein
MDDGGPLSPTTGWGVEALKIADELGGDPYRAFDRVLIRYLIGGDVRPLLHLLDHGKVPGIGAQRYIAAMISPEYRTQFPEVAFPYDIRFDENRRRGRPKLEQLDTRAPVLCAILQKGINTITSGHVPDARFWNALLLSLMAVHDPIQYRKQFGNDFPLKAKLRRTSPSKGRVRNPEFVVRDRALAWFVRESMKRGTTYEAALKEIGDHNCVSKETVRNAYTGAKKRQT